MSCYTSMNGTQKAKAASKSKRDNMPKKASDPRDCGEVSLGRVGCHKEGGSRGSERSEGSGLHVGIKRKELRRSWRKSRWRVEMSNLGHTRYEASMTAGEMWALRSSA